MTLGKYYAPSLPQLPYLFNGAAFEGGLTARIWKSRIYSPSLSLSSYPKDVSGGDACTSEEEPTFDPGYEPDWAVISTVRPQPRHSEPTRGRLSRCP